MDRFFLGVAISLMVLLTGCLPWYQSPYAKPPEESVLPTSEEFKEFKDIPIPPYMSEEKNSSFIYRTPNLLTGVLALKGNAEMASLIRFYEDQMERNYYWKKVSAFKSRQRTMLLFSKEDRYCVMMLYDKSFYTYAEIWIAPLGSEISAGILK